MQAVLESIRDLLGSNARVGNDRHHLDATMNWLCRAQDATGVGGVARMYHLRHGWGYAYPETTGYIIPTFLHYARLSGEPSFRERARHMAEWECRVQMREGSVMGGTVDQRPTPAIFNTGQVIFGWCAAYEDTQDSMFLHAALRAGDYLLSQQDEDGLWRKNLSHYCSAKTQTYAFNARSAWALLLLGEQTQERRYINAAAKNIMAVLHLALPNGWVESNCLTDARQPLLHTIGYTLQAMFECGVRLNCEQAIVVAKNGAKNLLHLLQEDGGLHGRYDRNWKPAVSWRCLTGEAQMAILWYRLAEFTHKSEWRMAADNLTTQVCKTQRLVDRPEVAGGVKASYPVYGNYLPYEYVNWAAKFLADALMLKLSYAFAGANG